MFFKRSLYTVVESVGIVQPELSLSNPASMDITVEIENIDVTATGK